MQNDPDAKAKKQIAATFAKWCRDEIRLNHYLSPENCNGDFVMNDPLNLGEGLAIADSSDISFHYARLNADDKMDALVTFQPIQCDGGNAIMWSQVQLLVLSIQGNYYVDEKYFDQYNPESGFFHLDSAATNTAFGTYFRFLEKDGHCCPSIVKPIKIDMVKKKLIHLKEK